MRNLATLSSLVLLVTAGSLPAQVGLNHLYVYVDSLTFDTVAGSAWFRDTFASVRQATIPSVGARWSGVYLFGRETYLELYRAGPGTPPAGTMALAFGVDRAGELDRVADRLRQAGRPGVAVMRRRPAGADTLDWFRQLSPAAADSAAIGPLVRWWVMEYAEDYLARRPNGDPALAGRVDRAAYNRPVYRPDLMLDDVVGVVLRLPEPQRGALAGHLMMLGLDPEGADGALQFRAGRVVIVLDAGGAGSPGLARVTLGLHRPASPHFRRLGTAELFVDGSFAQLLLPP